MAEGYCVKCKKKSMMVKATKVTKPRAMLKGQCKTCGTKINKFISKDSKE
jgi:protein-arginine kinase activator protein McsA